MPALENFHLEGLSQPTRLLSKNFSRFINVVGGNLEVPKQITKINYLGGKAFPVTIPMFYACDLAHKFMAYLHLFNFIKAVWMIVRYYGGCDITTQYLTYIWSSKV